MKVSKESSACGQTIGSLKVESETGMRIIGIRRHACWIYNPQADAILQAEDMLIVRGTEEGYKDLLDFLLGKQEVLD